MKKDDIRRDAAARKVLGRMEARARLHDLAARGVVKTRLEREVEALRVYLQEWRMHLESYFPRLGAPQRCSWVGKASPECRSAAEYLERSDKWAMEVIERSVEDLRKRPDGEALRAALRCRLLNETIGANVIRHGRLLGGVGPEEVEALADHAERELVAIVTGYGLPLVP